MESFIYEKAEER